MERDVATISVAGEVDLSATEEFLALAQDCFERCDHVQLDLEEMSFIDSSGLTILLLVRRQAIESGKQLTLTGVGAGTHRLLVVTGVHKLFDVAAPVAGDD